MSHEVELDELPAVHGAMAEFDTPEELVEACERASIDKFFLCIESSDPQFSIGATSEFLRDLGGKEVTLVPA